MSNIRWDDDQEETIDSSFDENVDDFVNQELEQQEEKTAAVMNEAVLRIEQANLYQILLNHNLFAKGSARPEIINKVESEMRAFILSRLEILLGIKQEKTQVNAPTEVILPFDNDQLEFLKALADKGLRRNFPMSISKPSLNPVQVTQSPINPVQSVGVESLEKSRPAVRKRMHPNNSSDESVLGKRLTNGNIQYNGVEMGPRKSKSTPRKNKSSNISEIDGKDLSQAVNPANPPKPFPSQAVVDQMHAQQVANIAQDSSGKATIAGIAAAKMISGK